jgi:exopolysaccharide biosynthesis polyprenyl glycosylphosphotransferase
MSKPAPTDPHADPRTLSRPSNEAGSEAEPGTVVAPSRVARDYRRVAIWMALCDGLAILLALSLAYLARFGTGATNRKFLIAVVLIPPAWIAIMAAFRLYGAYRLAPAEEFRRVIYAVAVGMVAIVIGSYWFKADLSREWVGLSWAFATIFVLAERRFWRWVVWRNHSRGRLTFKTLVVGTNDEARHLVRVMRATPLGYDPVGFVTTGSAAGEDLALPVVAGVDDMRGAIRDAAAGCVFVASSALRPEDMRAVTKSARLEGVEVRVSANLPEMLSHRFEAQPIGGLMAFSMWPVRLTGSQAVAKRSFDLVAGSVLFVLALPLWGAAALAVKTTSRGRATFRQTRIGLRGREFTLLKLRTMVDGAESRREEMEPANQAAAPLFKVRDDSRITKVGRFLRRWSIDEVPQLLNVLRGDMSLVGPRPPLPAEVARYEEWHRDRLEVRPGITGLWQVSGRSDLSFDDYVRLDLFYIENWSLAYDLFLLAKTLPAVIMGRGAF